jgi:hypothetical protein
VPKPTCSEERSSALESFDASGQRYDRGVRFVAGSGSGSGSSGGGSGGGDSGGCSCSMVSISGISVSWLVVATLSPQRSDASLMDLPPGKKK